MLWSIIDGWLRVQGKIFFMNLHGTKHFSRLQRYLGSIRNSNHCIKKTLRMACGDQQNHSMCYRKYIATRSYEVMTAVYRVQLWPFGEYQKITKKRAETCSSYDRITIELADIQVIKFFKVNSVLKTTYPFLYMLLYSPHSNLREPSSYVLSSYLYLYSQMLNILFIYDLIHYKERKIKL